jgi:hypothetical protein
LQLIIDIIGSWLQQHYLNGKNAQDMQDSPVLLFRYKGFQVMDTKRPEHGFSMASV